MLKSQWKVPLTFRCRRPSVSYQIMTFHSNVLMPFVTQYLLHILGAFLIPYFIAMFTCGIPLFLLEVSIGQYLGVGGMSVIGQICPIFKGVGYSAIAMVFLEAVYYVIIVAWTMYYILNLLYNIGNGLPWDECAKGSTYPD